MTEEAKKPIVKLVGQDGNAFAILGACRRVAKEAKWTPEQLAKFMDEATEGDYDHLLQTCMKHFDVR